MDDAQTVASTTLPGLYPTVSDVSGLTFNASDTPVVTDTGVSGNINVTVLDVQGFYTDKTSYQNKLEEWLATHLSLPQSFVAVTIPDPPVVPDTTLANETATLAGAATNTSVNLSAVVTAAPVTTVAPGITAAPGAPTLAPGATTLAPAATTLAPGATTLAPVATTLAPVATTLAPVATTLAPVATTLAPLATTLAPLATTLAPGTSATTTPSLRRLTDNTDNATAAGVVSIPSTGNPSAGVVPFGYEVTLPPGKQEISDKISTMEPADILAAFQSDSLAVTEATVEMTNPAPPGGLSGSFLLTANDTSATGIQSAVSQALIRDAIANLAGVFLGDVGPITFTTANPAVPIEPEPAGSSLGPNSQATGRRLTAGSVNAAFNISVPGLAAQGYNKDCTFRGILPVALDDVTQSGDIVQTNTIVSQPDATPPTVVTAGICMDAAHARTADTVWSFTNNADPQPDECRISNLVGMADDSVSYSETTVGGFAGGSDACGTCPSIAPNGTWPGVLIDDSHQAFGGLGNRQPLNLQCWPKNEAFDLMPCGFAVLETTERGWTGRCNNLEEDTTLQSEVDCQAACQQDPFCTVWMWATPTGGSETCFKGAGNQCWTDAPRSHIETVATSERLQHGYVNVLVDGGSLIQSRIQGLQNQFAENIAAEGLRGNATAQRDACRNICHSNVMCTVWQSYYDNGTTGNLGCWTENPGVAGGGQLLPYPLTQAHFENNGNENYLTGGQFIQHHCPVPTLPSRPPATTTTTAATTVLTATQLPPTPTPPESSFWNPWGFLISAVAVLAGVGAALCYFNSSDKTPKSKPAKRGVTPKAKKEPPPPPAAAPAPPPQPVVPLMQNVMVQPTIAQPLQMTTIQPPITTVAAQAVAQPVQPLLQSVAQPMVAQQMVAQPMATYAGAPQLIQQRPM